MTCWTCHEPVSGPVCVGCGAVQPPPRKPDPFTLLGVSRRYHLDLAEVEAKYRNLARVVHPDRFTTRPAVERRMSLQWAAALNEGRRILKDDQQRARYLATGSPHPSEKGPPLDPAFLEEMFEWRENPEQVEALAMARKADLDREIEALFTEWEEGRGDLSLVDDRLARLKYVAALVKDHDAQHRD